MKKLTGFSAVQLEAQLKKAEAERDEARAWARRLLAELHRVTDEREAMRSQLQALAEAASYTTPTD